MRHSCLVLFLASGLLGCGPLSAAEETGTNSQVLVQAESSANVTAAPSQLGTASTQKADDVTERALPSTPETEAGVCLCSVYCVGRTPAGRATYKNGQFVRCGC